MHLSSLRFSALAFVASCALCTACSSESSPADASPIDPSVLIRTGVGRDGLLGWNVMSQEYAKPSDVDMLSFEWDYFMVHDNGGKFTGSVGYLFANPRNDGAGGLGDLTPKGGNVAIAGFFGDETQVANYRNFGLGNSSISSTERAFDANDPATNQFGRMTPKRAAKADADDTLVLEGKTDAFAWNLSVVQDWTALSASNNVFAPMHGTDVGALYPDKESWNVNMLWPRTHVAGSITRLDTGEQIAVDGHGYRENSWGRWAFNLGGWDFAVVSDDTHNVSWAWQTYHKKSVQLDYVDVGFVENGAVKLMQFKADAKQVGWTHRTWTFDVAARVCVPLTTTVVAQNDEYRIEAQLELKNRQVPMLSDATAATKQYVIMIQFPMVQGKVIRRSDSAVVTTFSGQGGGEFSSARSQETSMTDEACNTWGATFASPMP